jgi:hypothetical protein
VDNRVKEKGAEVWCWWLTGDVLLLENGRLGMGMTRMEVVRSMSW